MMGVGVGHHGDNDRCLPHPRLAWRDLGVASMLRFQTIVRIPAPRPQNTIPCPMVRCSQTCSARDPSASSGHIAPSATSNQPQAIRHRSGSWFESQHSFGD